MGSLDWTNKGLPERLSYEDLEFLVANEVARRHEQDATIAALTTALAAVWMAREAQTTGWNIAQELRTERDDAVRAKEACEKAYNDAERVFLREGNAYQTRAEAAEADNAALLKVLHGDDEAPEAIGIRTSRLSDGRILCECRCCGLTWGAGDVEDHEDYCVFINSHPGDAIAARLRVCEKVTEAAPELLRLTHEYLFGVERATDDWGAFESLETLARLAYEAAGRDVVGS